MAYIMSYFTDDEAAGMHLAISHDLLKWEPYNEGKPVLVPDEGHILRDPFLARDLDGKYHVIFTDNWRSSTIAHSESKDLKNWSEIEHLSLFGERTDVNNCWAPEAFYDREKGKFRLIWSTSFQPLHWDVGNRIWTAETKDFRRVENVRPFFDPGYVVIDATVLPRENGYFMAFKDERGEKHFGKDYKAIRTCNFPNSEGGFYNISEMFTETFTEGPCLMEKEGRFYLFCDAFLKLEYRLYVSDDFINWSDITEQAKFPDRCKHFSIIQCDDV